MAHFPFVPPCSIFRLVLLLFAVVSMPTGLSARPQVIKLTTVAPKGSSYHQILQKMGEEWQRRSGDEVRVIIYPGGIQGGEAAMVERMQIGQTQAGLLSAGGLSEIESGVTGLQSLPMMFRDLAEVDAVGEKLRPRLERLMEAKGYVVLFWADTGWVRYFSKSPVRVPGDLRASKLLVWGGDPEQVDIMKEIGFSPVRLEASDIVTGLQTGLIDALACPPFFALVNQVYTSAPYMVEVNWAPLVGACVLSKRTWDRLPENLRPALRLAARRAGESMTLAARAEGAEAVAAMEEKWGLQVHRPTAEEKAQWHALGEQLYPKIRGRIVPADTFDEVRRLLAEHRKGLQPPGGKGSD